MKKFLCFLIALSAVPVLYGQQGSPSPVPSAATAPSPSATVPPGPLLNPFPDNTRYTLTIVNHRPKPAASEPAPKKTPRSRKSASKDATITMTGETKGKSAHLSIVQSNGGKEEQWTDGNLFAVMNSGAKDLTFSDAGIHKAPTPDWVSAENFAELTKQGEKSVLVFRAQIVPAGTEVVQDLEAEAQGQSPSPDAPKVDATALIDAETRLPVSVEEGDTTTTYKFEPLAPDTQIIPAAVQAALTERETKMQDSTRKAVLP